MRTGTNNQSIAIVSVPSEIRKDRAGKLNDPVRFEASAESLAKRLAGSGHVKVQTFSTLGKANLECVLHDVATQTNNQFQKLYLMLHGNDQSVELHTGKSVGPEKFAETLIQGLNWKNTLRNHLSETRNTAKTTAKNKPLILNLRLLACLTGWQGAAENGENQQSFALRMLNHIAQWMKAEVIEFSGNTRMARTEMQQWQFEVEVRVKAPRGWSVVLQDGHNISYWVPHTQAGRVDRQFARKFDAIHSKAEAHKTLGNALLPEKEKSQVNILSFSKYANLGVQIDIRTC